ncbi:hypothetical protein [Piscinibacter sp. XHJ-5]|uniref:hypothetical protein n=1 Tax=Piscinibacter sp. XHJ-5 TaxID=3037797 RepID=UPI0024530987|nr:hypothetical protein [Piscinibacter sp. XHJ-5]
MQRTLARREGVVHQSGSYPLQGFSDAEWTSEWRERCLVELGEDVSQVEGRLTPPGR